MFDEIGNGVFRRRYESLDLNVGVIIGDDGVLIVDTRANGQQGLELRDELANLIDLPVRWVVNTHWHWDHTFGNAAFTAAEIWGHELCQIALVERGEEMKADAREWLDPVHHDEVDQTEIVPPRKTFSERFSLDIGREVRLSYHGFAHTDSDTVIRVDDVAFFGDLIEEGAPPAFDDSYPVAWPLALRLASEDLPPTIVPGHGDLVGPEFVRSQHEELVAVAEAATAVVSGDLDIDEAASRGPYPEDVMRGALIRAQAVA